MQGRNLSLLTILLVSLAACSSKPDRAPAIGEAFAGPMTLNVRQEISLKSSVVATIKHGELLEVLSTRRRFMRVRVSTGAEGWVDSEKLLTTAQMARLRAVAEAAGKLPVQAEATVYDARNVHTEPHRQSPSFHQIKEEEHFYVVAHRLMERGPYQSAVGQQIEKTMAPVRKKKAIVKAKPKDRRRGSDVELPPMPPGPAVPKDWLEISRRLPPEEPLPPPKKEPTALSLLIRAPQEPAKYEDWSLVRTKDGRAGWILTRTMTMTIPDDVSRYAEGHRITSWFDLGEAKDDEVTKHHYLWTTIAKGAEPYEFDGFRVFIYNLRKHRYETGYREKNVKGYFPSAIHPVETRENRKTITTQGFSVIVENDDGKQVRKTFSFLRNRVHLESVTPWAKLEDPLDVRAAAITTPASPATVPRSPGIWDRMKQTLPWSKK